MISNTVNRKVLAQIMVGLVKKTGSDFDKKRCTIGQADIWTGYIIGALRQIIKEDRPLKIGKLEYALVRKVESDLSSSKVESDLSSSKVESDLSSSKVESDLSSSKDDLKSIKKRLKKIRSQMKCKIHPAKKTTSPKGRLSPKIDNTDILSLESADIRAAKEGLMLGVMGIKPRLPPFPDDLYIKVYVLLRDSDLTELAANLQRLKTYDFLEPYRGIKCGKYGTDKQINRCSDKDRLPDYVDRSDPEVGFALGPEVRTLQDSFFEKIDEWHYYFLNGEINPTPVDYQGYDLYRPSQPEHLEELKQLGYHKPENWMYPGCKSDKFSIVKNLIESEWTILFLN